MKKTIAAVSALLLAATSFNTKSTMAQQLMSQDHVMHADISEMVIEDDLSHLRMLVNATKAKADATKKKADQEDAGEEVTEENTDGEPDDKSVVGDEEDELASKQGAPEISEEQQEAADSAADDKTEKDFANKALDTTEDFTPDQFKPVAKKGPKYMMKVKKFGAVSQTNSFSFLTNLFHLLGYGTPRAKSQIIRQRAPSKKPQQKKELRTQRRC